jgi:hypothetical protein
MSDEDKKEMCEAYFHIEEEEMTNGVNVKSRKVTIQGIGHTVNEAMALFDHVKKEMNAYAT